jgi:hypothetical protein
MMRKDSLLTREQMEALTTERLLAYKNRLYKVPEGPSYDEWEPGGTHYGVHKECPEWQQTLATAKEILSTREHVER